MSPRMKAAVQAAIEIMDEYLAMNHIIVKEAMVRAMLLAASRAYASTALSHDELIQHERRHNEHTASDAEC